MSDLERKKFPIIEYQGSHLEAIQTRSLVFAEGHQKESRLFIPGDIAISRYGVIGFVIIDSKPEKRWISYQDYSAIGVPHETAAPIYNDKALHYTNTDHGFKMIRYFILPPKVGEFFAQDKFLGRPMIDKCCLDETLPEDFDESVANPSHLAFGDIYSDGTEELLMTIARACYPQLTQDELKQYERNHNQYAYLSFHPNQDFQFATHEGQNAVYAALSNFDDFIARFDTNQTLEVRDLLPPAQSENLITTSEE